MADVVERYNLLCGGGALPPLWGLGFWHRVHAEADERLDDLWRRRLHARALLCIPLLGKDEPIGFLFFIDQRAPRLWRADEVSWAESFATHAALALEKAYLYSQVERVATLEERQRIAAEMHDGLAQILSYMALKADYATELLEDGQVPAVLEHYRDIQAAIERATREVRMSIASLRENPQPREPLQVCLERAAIEAASARPEIRRVYLSTNGLGLDAPWLDFLAGQPKVGKSWFALQMAEAVSTGGCVLGRQADKGKALYLALEDSPGRMKWRMRTQGWSGEANDRIYQTMQHALKMNMVPDCLRLKSSRLGGGLQMAVAGVTCAPPPPPPLATMRNGSDSPVGGRSAPSSATMRASRGASAARRRSNSASAAAVPSASISTPSLSLRTQPERPASVAMR